MAPVGRDLSERHEALLVGDRAEAGIGSEAGECLSEASVERGGEVADAVVAARAVKAVTGGWVLKQAGAERVGEAEGVR